MTLSNVHEVAAATPASPCEEAPFIADPMEDLAAATEASAKRGATPPYIRVSTQHLENALPSHGSSRGGQTASVQSAAGNPGKGTAAEPTRAFCSHDAVYIAPKKGVCAPDLVTEPLSGAQSTPHPFGTFFRMPTPALEAADAIPAAVRDHALYVLGLLSSHTLLDENGWRPLTRSILDERLGQSRVNGHKVQRSGLLLGSRADPDTGELITRGLVERYPSFCESHSQCYRLKDRSWLDAPREDTVVVLRPRGKQRTRKVLAPDDTVPDFLASSYPHTIDIPACVYFVCEAMLAGVTAENVGRAKLLPLPPTSLANEVLATGTLDAVAAYLTTIPLLKPPERKGRRGRPPKNVCKDLRERWMSALEHVWRCYKHSRTDLHDLNRVHGRLFSPFVQLWSPLRRFVHLNGERLVELDIRNAQPLLIAARVLQTGLGDEPDVKMYVRHCEAGTLYEYAFKCLYGYEPTTAQRDHFKQGFFGGWMFAKLVDMDRESGIGAAMKVAFPNVDAFVREEKAEDYAEFPVACQRFESSLMVDRLAAVFGPLNLRPLTCHDAVYVAASQAEDAARALQTGVLGGLPVRAQVKPKPLPT